MKTEGQTYNPSTWNLLMKSLIVLLLISVVLAKPVGQFLNQFSETKMELSSMENENDSEEEDFEDNLSSDESILDEMELLNGIEFMFHHESKRKYQTYRTPICDYKSGVTSPPPELS